MKKSIKSKLWKYIILGLKLYLVSYLSYYLLKLIEGNSYIEELLSGNERAFLRAYTTIQFIVTALGFIGTGYIIEFFVKRWIKNNDSDIVVSVNRNEERDLRTFTFFIITALLKIRLISISDLEGFEEMELDPRKRNAKWRSTIKIIKDIFGILVLSIATFLALWGTGKLYAIIISILSLLIILTIIGLRLAYVIINNPILFNTFIRGIKISHRKNSTPNQN